MLRRSTGSRAAQRRCRVARDREFSCGIVPAEPAAEAVANREEQAGCHGLSVGRVERRHDLKQRSEVLGTAFRWKRPDILEPEVGRDIGDTPAAGFWIVASILSKSEDFFPGQSAPARRSVSALFARRDPLSPLRERSVSG